MAPMTGLIFHPEARREMSLFPVAVKKLDLYELCIISCILPERSPFTRGVWGFLVTTLAVALFT